MRWEKLLNKLLFARRPVKKESRNKYKLLDTIQSFRATHLDSHKAVTRLGMVALPCRFAGRSTFVMAESRKGQKGKMCRCRRLVLPEVFRWA